MAIGGTELFGRRVKVQVDNVVVGDGGLDVAFEVQKSLRAKTPNTAEVRIYNLNPDHRKHLQELEKVFVSVEAGYEQGSSLIFRGDLRHVFSTREHTDWVTTITSDSGRTGRKRRIAQAFSAKASVRDVLNAAAKGMGIGLGNTAAKTLSAKIAGTQAQRFFNGYTLAGVIEDELDRLARMCGFEWSVQDNELQILDDGKALADTAIVLSSETGLIGSPEPGSLGRVRVRSLMIPDVFPGRRVQVDSEHVKGVYRIETTKHTGSTFGDEWYIDSEIRSEERKP